MLSQLFLGISLIGAEWVLYVLLLISVLSVTLMVERTRFYRHASQGLAEFREKIRAAASKGRWEDASQLAQARAQKTLAPHLRDMEIEMALALLAHREADPKILNEIAHDAVMRARLGWEKNLSILATIGSNAPFVGLFGTVLGIIKAFHDLSQQAGTGAQTVSSGISEALVATAIGLLVAIPAVVSFNIFQRRVKAAVMQAEALKSFLVGTIANGR
jgi:biopolymer transport protein ExbB